MFQCNSKTFFALHRVLAQKKKLKKQEKIQKKKSKNQQNNEKKSMKN